VPTPHRGRNSDITALKEKEWLALSGCVPRGARRVLLDETGRTCSTSTLAQKLEDWMHEGRDTAFIIGGPDGLPPTARVEADETWSLSPLTLPHGLVRIIVVEQLYRALSILADHPYHRG
jgi:23S rRNA (pseudouridine1915-N3)-methyltransferase